jgi:hypothetical protein
VKSTEAVSKAAVELRTKNQVSRREAASQSPRSRTPFGTYQALSSRTQAEIVSAAAH